MPEPVDVVLLAYNRPDYLEQMVAGLAERTRWPYRLTIVDNASGPATREWLRAHSASFHQIVWNRRNEHLAGHARGIAATRSELFVLSDADLLPHPPTAEGCWLTRLVELAQRHPDFGLIGARLDSVSDARNRHLEAAPLRDGEIIETATGVWLNLIRRSALPVPYMSDGITGYALRRAGYRVGIAAGVWCTHLGDQDPERHPDYLARKRAGFGVVYPRYPELRGSPRPPLLVELALAAPVLAALERAGLDPADVVELSRERWPPLSAVEPRIDACVRGRAVAAARFSYDDAPPLRPGGAAGVAVLCPSRHDRELLDDAVASAGEWVVLLTPEAAPALAAGWSLEAELPAPHPVVRRLAGVGSRRRLRRALSYSTSEQRAEWRALMAAACFGDDAELRVYLLHRDEPRPAAAPRWQERARPARPPRRRPPSGRSGRLGALLTKAIRLVRAEWHLRRRR